MGTIIFTVTALIILIPLLYFLPLGFKKQGKLIIIASSLCLALIGLLANTVFELWQTSLLLLLFALAATYLIEKKLSSFVFADTSTEEVKTVEDDAYSSDNKQSLDSDRSEPAVASPALQENINSNDPSLNEDEIEEVKHNEILDGVVLAQTSQEENTNDSILPVDAVLESDDEDHQDILIENDQETLAASNDEESQNWADLEELNDLHKVNDELDLNLEEPTTNTLDDNSIVDYNIDEIIEESKTQASYNNDLNIDEIEEVDHSTTESVNTDVFAEEDKVLDEPENDVDEYDSVIEPAKGDSSSSDETLSDPISFGEEVESGGLEESALVAQENINDLDLVKEKRKNRLQKQMFHTMVSQLQLSRKYLSVTEYEKRVKDHLHPNLPAQDYYTFSYLLIEHYISEHNERELHSLINHLKDKFTNFVIIQQQLDFLEQHYCKK